MGNATVRVTGEESRPTKHSERMEGNFLKKGKRKLSQKNEKGKLEMEKFKIKKPKGTRNHWETQ